MSHNTLPLKFILKKCKESVSDSHVVQVTFNSSSSLVGAFYVIVLHRKITFVMKALTGRMEQDGTGSDGTGLDGTRQNNNEGLL